jgi:mono/diheme cytochrome c family protein
MEEWMIQKRKSIFLTGLVIVVLFALVLAACAPKTDEPEEAAKPSNGGGPGEAISLTGDATSGEAVFTANCVACHGDQGKGGVSNPGSGDGTVPSLNPIDSTMVNADKKIFATNIDLFIEHGSKPEGDNPALVLAAWGDQKTLTPQQIADVIAYINNLNGK